MFQDWHLIPYKTQYTEHRYRGGPPPMRLRTMQMAHEGRARREGVPYEQVDLRLVYTKTAGRCGICGNAVEFETFTVDHVVPMSRGGHHVFSNLQPAHRSCNSQKGNRLIGVRS